jgi:general secretion pathway protein K
MVALAVLTALAVDLAYETSVSLRIAANARDGLRAEYLARGAVNLSRAVLHIQQELDGPQTTTPPQLPGQAGRPGQAGNPAQAAAAAALGGGALPVKLRIYDLVPVNSGILGPLFGGAGSEEPARAPPREGAPALRFGDFDGAFTAKLVAEDAKVNARLDALQVQQTVRVADFGALFGEPRWDPLFEREDGSGTKATRQELLVYLLDWVDANSQGSAFTGFGNAKAFEDGFGDENYPYDRADERYRAKNAPFDSLDELHLVAGVTDAFMAAFGDRLTVYVRKEGKRNVNSTDCRELVLSSMLVAETITQPAFSDAEFAPKLCRAVRELTFGGLIAITPDQFVTLVKGLGVRVDRAFEGQEASKVLSDRSLVFTVKAEGYAGDVVRKVEAVVSFDERQNTDPVVVAQGLGRLLHWREE